MRILLSGGSGFVGQHLVRLLKGCGHTVTAPSSTAWDLRNAIRTSQVVARAGPDVVFHLAAHTALVAADRSPDRVRGVNVGGTEGLLAAVEAEAPDARVVIASTCHVYGSPQVLPVDEDHPLAPVGAYACSKRDAELVTRRFDLDWVIVRPFHLTGPGQPSTHAASDWARQAAAGAGHIRCGELSLTRDFLDVRDACRALWLVAGAAPPRSTFNVCSGEEWRLRDILAVVAPGVEPHVDLERLRSHDVPRLVGDPTRLQALGWKPEVTVEESLRALRRGWDESLR